MGEPSSDGRRNRVLAALPEPAYRACRRELEPVELGLREVLFEPDEPVRVVYFPLTAVVSLVTPLSDGSGVECATVGNDGLIGLAVFLGAPSLPLTAVAQVPGLALRMEAATFRRQLADVDGPLVEMLQRYTVTLATQLAQNVACNRRHSVEQRCARWLLMTADRTEGPRFPLTHESLAQMLGVRRASISEVAARLAQTGSVSYTRGMVSVLDRGRLEQATCECYGVLARVADSMLGGPVAAAPGGP
jgi:CRP-like cAMP-binding protein